jgi:mannose-1-phosphate guanylyltransferase
MLPVVNRPMIERVLEHLAMHGIDEAVLALGYRPEPFLEAYPDGTCGGVRLRYAVESSPLDTAGAIRFAATEAGFDRERIVVVNGDVLTDLDVGGLVDFHDRSGGAATIDLHRVDDPSLFGVVPTDDAGRVLAFVEKPRRDEAPSDLINAGTYVLEPDVLDRIPADRPVSIERETFPALVDDRALFAVDGDAYWIDAGTPSSFLQANLDLLNGVRGEPEHGVAAGAIVQPGATIERSVVGIGSAIAASARLTDSVVFGAAVIEPNVSVERSIVGAGSRIAEGARLDDLTVVGSASVVPAGTHLSGARVPEAEPA